MVHRHHRGRYLTREGGDIGLLGFVVGATGRGSGACTGACCAQAVQVCAVVCAGAGGEKGDGNDDPHGGGPRYRVRPPLFIRRRGRCVAGRGCARLVVVFLLAAQHADRHAVGGIRERFRRWAELGARVADTL